jgi:site-specific recombinase XerD
VLRYLSLLEARNYASSTLLVVAGALKSLTRHLPDTRRAALIADLTQTTSQDISDFVCAAQKAGLAPTTINTKLSLLIEFFEFLREEGLITQQPATQRHQAFL